MAPPAWALHSFVIDLKVVLSFWVAELWDNYGWREPLETI